MPLDNRTWLAWGIAMSIPATIGRNPWMLLELMIIVLTVRSVCSIDRAWSGIVRIVTILVGISIVFNVLTVRSGDRVLATLPIFGGSITLNAVVYGVVSGLAIFVIVLTWTQVAARLRWSSLMRQLPARFTDIAVAGSVAWSYLPSMRRTLQDIRETQRSRGWEGRRVRDLPALIIPVLAGGLERSMMTAEVLETRGFGGATVQARSLGSAARMMMSLVSIVSGVYCLAVGLTGPAIALLVGGLLLIATEIRSGRPESRATRLRGDTWTRTDTATVACAGLAVLVVLFVYSRDATQLTFNPYPVLAMPPVDILLLGGLFLLFAPAVFAVMAES